MKQGHSTELIRADIEFHKSLYDMSGNGMIRATTQPNWPHFSRVMGEVLLQDDIWDQYEAIVQAIRDGDEKSAGTWAEQHILLASIVIVARHRNLEQGTEAAYG